MAFGMLIFGVVPSINSDGAVVQYKIDGWAASEANFFFLGHQQNLISQFTFVEAVPTYH